MDRLLKAFQSELEAREELKQFQTRQRQLQALFKISQGPFPTAAALLSPQEGKVQASKTSITCSFSRQKHSSASCTVVTDVRTRKNLLRAQGRCFLCLKRSHLLRDCTSSIKCAKCSRPHHLLICDSDLSNITTDNSPREETLNTAGSDQQETSVIIANSAETTIIPDVNTEVTSQPGGSVTNLYVNSKTQILLQTARTRVSRADNQNYEINARVLFNSGSQCNYVKSNLKEQLAVPTLRKEKLIIKTFVNENEELRECDIVQLCLRPLYDDLNIYLTVYSIPVICSQICDQPVKFPAEKYEHLQGLQLADNTVSESDPEITILIGSDQIWNFINGSMIRGQTGPIALESKLGYICRACMGKPPLLTELDRGQSNIIKVTVHSSNM